MKPTAGATAATPRGIKMVPLRQRQRALEEWDRPDPSRVRIAQRVRAFPTPQRVNLNDPLNSPCSHRFPSVFVAKFMSGSGADNDLGVTRA